MTLQERLKDADERAKTLYRDMQAWEQSRGQLLKQMQEAQIALYKTDGEVELLTNMITEQATDAH